MQMVVVSSRPMTRNPLRALISAGYRVSPNEHRRRLLSPRNVTLLVGVEQAQVDDVLRVIEHMCASEPRQTRLSQACPCSDNGLSC